MKESVYLQLVFKLNIWFFILNYKRWHIFTINSWTYISNCFPTKNIKQSVYLQLLITSTYFFNQNMKPDMYILLILGLPIVDIYFSTQNIKLVIYFQSVLGLVVISILFLTQEIKCYLYLGPELTSLNNKNMRQTYT